MGVNARSKKPSQDNCAAILGTNLPVSYGKS